MNPTLMRAIIDLAAFIELSGEDIIEPDAATKALEDLVSVLSHLTQSECDEFVAYVEELAKSQQERKGSKEFIEFLVSFPDGFGLRD